MNNIPSKGWGQEKDFSQVGNKLQKSMNSSDPPQKTHPERPAGGNWNTGKRLETRNKNCLFRRKGRMYSYRVVNDESMEDQV